MSEALGGQPFKLGSALITVALFILGLWLVGATASVFLLLFLAIIISLFLGAVRDALVEKAKMPPRLAFFLAVIGTVVGVLGLFAILVPPVIEQTRALIITLPATIENWESGMDHFVARFPAMRDFWTPGQHQFIRAVYDRLSSGAGDVVPKVFLAVNVLIEIFAVFVMSIYLALQPGVYREWLIALFPPVHRDLIRDVLRDLANALRAYIVAQLTAMSVLAALTAFGLYLLDVPYWLTFGIFTGAVAIIPFFGTLLSTTLPALFVLSGPGGGTRALMVMGLGVIVHLIEGNLVAPLVMSHKVELPPVLTIMSVLVIGKILGPMGLVIALPMLASVMVIVRRILINRIYEGRGFRKSTRDRMFLLRVPAPDGGVMTPGTPGPDVLRERIRIGPLMPPPIVRAT